MRVLLIDKNASSSIALKDLVNRLGLICDHHDGLPEMLSKKPNAYSAIVINTEDAEKQCQLIRERLIRTPIMILSSRKGTKDVVRGLESGADDYVGKPFEVNEFAARVRALVRRDQFVKMAILKIGDLVIDTQALTVKRAGKEIKLTDREFTLLVELATNHSQVVTRDTIRSKVWGDEYSTSNTIDVHIRHLRRKIDEGYDLKMIHTIFGRGYMLKASSYQSSADTLATRSAL